MNAHDARMLAARHRDALHALLAGVFGDAATAEKFVRFTLQRLEVDLDEIEGDARSPRALFLLARETCREYVASGTFARTPFAQGDDGLPLAGVLPAGAAPAELVAALPRSARLALRVVVVDGLALEDLEPLFGASLPHLERFLARVANALAQGGKLAMLAPVLSDLTALCAPDPAVHVVHAHSSPQPAARGPQPVDVTQPGTLYTPPSADDTAVPGRHTRTTVNRLVPRGVSLSPLVSGGHPANRPAQAAPFTRPFPTRTVPVLEEPSSPARNHALTAGLLLFLVAAGFPLSGAYHKTAREAAAVVSRAGASAATAVAPAKPVGGIGTVELPGCEPAVLRSGQRVAAPARGEAKVTLAGVEIWLYAGSRAVVEARRLVLQDGVARIAVAAVPGAFVGVADPLELKLTAGTYVLRRGAKGGSALATLSGVATAVSESARGLKVEAGRTLELAADPAAGVAVRDSSDLPDAAWGREATRIARAAAAGVHFSALPGAESHTARSPGAGANGRPLYAAAGAGSCSAIGGAGGADRGAAAYRQSF